MTVHAKFSRIAGLLNWKLRKDQQKEVSTLTAEEASAMEELKDPLISPPVLALP